MALALLLSFFFSLSSFVALRMIKIKIPVAEDDYQIHMKENKRHILCTYWWDLDHGRINL